MARGGEKGCDKIRTTTAVVQQWVGCADNNKEDMAREFKRNSSRKNGNNLLFEKQRL